MGTTTKEAVIPFDSDEAASVQTVTGWMARGHFFGEDERGARYFGCTHKPCEGCGELIPKSGIIYCRPCAGTRDAEKYAALPRQQWDGETPLVIYGTDRYFFNEDELDEYCAEHGVAREDLPLVICVPQRPRYVDAMDFLEDVLPEDADEWDVPTPIRDAVEQLNKAIDAAGVLSWTEGKRAATFAETSPSST
jgi:hypothetical protein